MKSVGETETPIGVLRGAWRPGGLRSCALDVPGPPKLRGTLPFSPDSRRAGRIFRNLGGIRGVEARGVALPCSTPLLAVQRRGPCRPAGAPPLFPCPSREGEGVPAGFLPFPAPGRGREVTLSRSSELGARSLEAPRVSGRLAMGSQDLDPGPPLSPPSPGSIRGDRAAHAVGAGPVGQICEVRERANGGGAGLCEAAAVSP